MDNQTMLSFLAACGHHAVTYENPYFHYHNCCGLILVGCDRFAKHPFIPSFFLADFHVLWNAILVSETEICQGDGSSDIVVTNSLRYNFSFECHGVAGREVATK